MSTAARRDRGADARDPGRALGAGGRAARRLAQRSPTSRPGWCRSTRAPPAWLARRGARALRPDAGDAARPTGRCCGASCGGPTSSTSSRRRTRRSCWRRCRPGWWRAALGKPVLLNYHSGEAPDHLRRSRLARAVLRRIGADDRAVALPGRRVRAVRPRRRGHSQRHRSRALPLPRAAIGCGRACSRPATSKPNYNVACTLRAFARVQARHPDATLTVVGSGSEAPALQALAASLGLRGVTLRRPRRAGRHGAPLRRRRHLRADAGRRQHAAVGARSVRERRPGRVDRRRRRPRDADRRRARPAGAARRRRRRRRRSLPPARGAGPRRRGSPTRPGARPTPTSGTRCATAGPRPTPRLVAAVAGASRRPPSIP